MRILLVSSNNLKHVINQKNNLLTLKHGRKEGSKDFLTFSHFLSFSLGVTEWCSFIQFLRQRVSPMDKRLQIKEVFVVMHDYRRIIDLIYGVISIIIKFSCQSIGLIYQTNMSFCSVLFFWLVACMLFAVNPVGYSKRSVFFCFAHPVILVWLCYT